jgi:hypothetical protein
MLKLKVLTSFFAFVFLFHSSWSQTYTDEIGLMVGGSYYLGELNPYKHLNNYNYNFGGVFRRTLDNKQIVLRAHIMYGKVSAASSTSNLSFQSTILEIGPAIEINFMPFIIGEKKKYKGTPYLFAGFTYFKMNPQTKYNGDWVSLQTLGTEGQESSQNSNKHYKSQQLSIPLGIGLKINLSKRFALNFEYGIRKTFTDYLDDVSGTYVNLTQLESENGEISSELSKGYGINGLQRGNAQNKDWYAIYGVTLSYRITTNKECKRNFLRKKR